MQTELQKAERELKTNIGNIYWFNPKDGISHPHVVIQLNEPGQNKKASVTICCITTNKKKASMPGVVIIEAGEGNLEKQSIVEVYKTLTIEESQLGEYIGTLSEKRVQEILAGIKFIQKSFFEGRLNSPILPK